MKLMQNPAFLSMLLNFNKVFILLLSHYHRLSAATAVTFKKKPTHTNTQSVKSR